MRVLFLTDSLSDLDGVGRYAVRLIAALEDAGAGVEVEVLLGRKHRPSSADVRASWDVSVCLPPDHYYYMTPLRFWANTLLYLPRVVAAARRADIVHCVKDFPHSWLGALAAKIAGKPCVATAHGTYSTEPLRSSRHKGRALWAAERYARWISVSGFTKRGLLEVLEGRGPSEEEIAVVSNGVNAAHYAQPRDIGERPWHGKRYTLAIGELKERKGHHVSLPAWLQIADRHPELEHFIVGRPAGDEYEASLRAMARDAGAEDRVHFLGNVEEDEKVDLLQRADAFIHTPVTAADGGFEGFGIVYLEAAACGTPSVGTLRSGAEDAVEVGVTGVLVEPDVDAVAAGIEEVLGGDGPGRFAEAARAHASGCSWERNAQDVLEMYREVLK
ncbi:MAG: glycosyltransferase family 4 protein [Planctomycetes bacterium]|nr:glycosyltransferase family 4 protein [Planctomycetota bacterium]